MRPLMLGRTFRTELLSSLPVGAGSWVNKRFWSVHVLGKRLGGGEDISRLCGLEGVCRARGEDGVPKQSMYTFQYNPCHAYTEINES